LSSHSIDNLTNNRVVQSSVLARQQAAQIHFSTVEHAPNDTALSAQFASSALKLLSELHREFQKPLHVAYIDLKSAFDSVDRKALWLALKGKGIPP